MSDPSCAPLPFLYKSKRVVPESPPHVHLHHRRWRESLLGLSLTEQPSCRISIFRPRAIPDSGNIACAPSFMALCERRHTDFQFLDFLPSYPLLSTANSARGSRYCFGTCALSETMSIVAFHMLQLVSFLCHFVGYTTAMTPSRDVEENIQNTIGNGRLQYADLLRSPCPPPFLFGGQVPMSNLPASPYRSYGCDWSIVYIFIGDRSVGTGADS
ncbi:hypothetical protein B0H13DRAFT_2382642 [Mycena leptocephala]|nr:hypothetical protein B0H13DRAFT_2382642 [Mycena leptocephala]